MVSTSPYEGVFIFTIEYLRGDGKTGFLRGASLKPTFVVKNRGWKTIVFCWDGSTWCELFYTLAETKIAPENGWLEY